MAGGPPPAPQGANGTGRPFTADFAGWLRYGTLKKLHLAEGEYQAADRSCLVGLQQEYLGHKMMELPAEGGGNPQVQMRPDQVVHELDTGPA